MFRNSLYKVKQVITEDIDSKFSVIIELNLSHEIFTGHFPGNPILPGVCMIQILKELLEDHLDSKLILQNASSVKYINVIDPRVNNMIQFNFELAKNENGAIGCKALLNYETLVFCRFKGEFNVITK
jgi:3-hydroxyacyl-[acyl-carrier-protein] dehydratase